MELIRCNVCGSDALIKTDFGYKCAACGATYQDEDRVNEEAALTSVAFQDLRRQEFGDAEEAFTDIINKYPNAHSAYWGRVLARYGIKYEEDYNGKKIPTCCMPSIESFGNDKDFLKAVDLAPEDVKKWYVSQSEYIDRIRKTWIDKASKVEPYDVFICYKDSDLKNGVERTNDSYEAYEIYTRLKDDGYRVFFSRESLSDKVGEKYEPYIYNALQTAKVMIVYASSVEYVNSAWLKNEWHRYLKKIENGEKGEDSLLVVCSGFSANELPKALSQKQCLETSKKTWFYDLNRAVKKIIEAQSARESARAATRDFERITEAKPQGKKAIKKIHEHKYLTKVIPATCINRGYTLHYCACGEEYRTDATGLTDHKYKLNKTIPPTCSEKGQDEYVCTVCGDKKVENIPATGHNFGDWKIQVYPECETDGVKARQCENCGFVDKEVIHKTGHKFGKWVEKTHPTCTAEGLEIRQCENCGKEESRALPKTAHNFGAWRVDEHNANKEERVCKDCGKKETRPRDAKRHKRIRRLTIGGIIAAFVLTFLIVHLSTARLNTMNVDGFTFEKSWDGYCLTAIDEVRGKGDVVIPSEIRGLKVTSVGEGAFENCKTLTSITIPDSVTSIGKTAFEGCNGLIKVNYTGTIDQWAEIKFGGLDSNPLIYAKNLYINNELVTEINLTAATKVSSMAFEYCNSLTSVTISHSVTNIEDYAFRFCKSLKNVTINKRISSFGKSVFAGCNSLETLTLSHVDGGHGAIGYLFGGDDPSNNYKVVPESLKYVTLIGSELCSFEGCKSLINVNIPNGVKSIGWNNFEGCRSLTSITIPDGVTVIGADAFKGCSSLISVNIPDSVTSIQEQAFNGCSSLTSITIPDSVTSIGDRAFYGCSSLKDLTIGNGVTSMSEEILKGCNSLENLTIPFVGLGDNAEAYERVLGIIFGYTNDSSEKDTTLQYGVSSTGKASYSRQYYYYIPETLKSVTVTGGTISTNAFFNCKNITNIILSEKVTSIAKEAFYNCTGLETITLPFIGESKTSKYDSGVFGYIFGYYLTTKYEYTERAVYQYCGGGQIGYTYYSECYYMYYVPTNLKNVTISGDKVPANAFQNCLNITNIKILNDSCSIGDNAFYGCKSLSNLELPNSVTDLGEQSFYGCDALTSIVISGKVKAISLNALRNCSSLKEVNVLEGVTEIEGHVFDGCKALSKVTLPKSISLIADGAFYGCHSLTAINYSGSKAQWNSIQKSSGWNSYSSITKIICSDGEIAV